MLRAARFHAGYQLRPAPGLLVAIESMLDRVSIVSAERVRDEFQKIILLDDPTDALVLMVETGLMAAALPVLGELDVDDAREIGGQLGAVPADPAKRWTVVFGPASAHGLDRSDLKRLKFSNQLTDDVLRLSSCLAFVSGSRLVVSEASARSEVMAASGSSRSVDDRLAFVRSLRLHAGASVDDIDGLQAVIDDLRSRENDFDDPVPALTGDEVCAALGIEPGPVVGAALEELRNHRLLHGPLDRDAAVARLRAWWHERSTEGGG
jgi:poly(A) polymerase